MQRTLTSGPITGSILLGLCMGSGGSREKVDALTARLKADGLEVLSGPRTTGDGYYESCVRSEEHTSNSSHEIPSRMPSSA